jgi:hypothetical protein
MHIVPFAKVTAAIDLAFGLIYVLFYPAGMNTVVSMEQRIYRIFRKNNL